MAEVITRPTIDNDGNATFSESCTIRDIIRYAIECSDLQTVEFIVSTWNKYNDPT